MSGGRGAPWAHDWPRGEEHLLKILGEITATSAHTTESSIMDLSDPELFKFPVAYMAELPGTGGLNEVEARALSRTISSKGGFLILDDFRGPGLEPIVESAASPRCFRRARWVDLDANHAIFHSFFEINSLDIIPQAYSTSRPVFRGALRKTTIRTSGSMIIAAYNTDMSEFWEWSDTGYAPRR